MAFFKKMLKKINKKWYPQSVLVGSPVTTAQVAKRLAAESTVSPADVAAVLTSLGPVMADYMSQGRSVKLDGIGSFYFTAVSAKGGVDAAEKVSANQIVGVRVRFNPETHYERGGGSRVATRGLTDTPIEWEEWKGEEKKKYFENEFVTFKTTVKENEDLVISGLGWINVKRGPLAIELTVPKGVKVIVRPSIFKGKK